MKIFLLFHSWTRGGMPGGVREPGRIAYRTKDAAFAAIAEAISYIFSNEAVPEGLSIDPDPAFDHKNSNHNHGALKFSDEDIAGHMQVDLRGPLPEGVDDPAQAEFRDLFEIEEVTVDWGEGFVSDTTECLTADQRALLDLLRDGGHDSLHPRAADGTVCEVYDGCGILSEGDPWPVLAVWACSDAPRAKIVIDGKAQTIILTATETTHYNGERECSFWDISSLTVKDGLRCPFCDEPLPPERLARLLEDGVTECPSCERLIYPEDPQRESLRHAISALLDGTDEAHPKTLPRRSGFKSAFEIPGDGTIWVRRSKGDDYEALDGLSFREIHNLHRTLLRR